MGNLAKIKQQFTLIVAVLSVVDLILIGYLVWPGTSVTAMHAKEQALQHQESTLKEQVAPLHDIGGKLAETRVTVKKFYEQKVPGQFSEISKHLEKLIQDSGVTAPAGIHYGQEKSDRPEKNDLPDVQRISIDTSVQGEYEKVAKFINALEQDKYVFIINQILLNSQDGSVVSLQIKFETFLKET